MLDDLRLTRIKCVNHYFKIYVILLVLFVISVLGPEWSTSRFMLMTTAFGIAIVKALMVAAYFMHLNIEKKFIHYMLWTMLLFVVLFFFAIAPDVMTGSGTQWMIEK